MNPGVLDDAFALTSSLLNVKSVASCITNSTIGTYSSDYLDGFFLYYLPSCWIRMAIIQNRSEIECAAFLLQIVRSNLGFL